MKKTKRQGEPLDPVYPFGDETPAPLPPFLNAGGGLIADGLTLSVQTADPLTVTLAGVGLKIGDGLAVEDGKLVSGNKITTVAPLQQSASGEISLVTDNMFSVSTQGKLTLPLQNSLTSTDTGLAVTSPISPLSLSNGAMQIATGAGLINLNGALSVATGQGINVNSMGQIEMRSLLPLQWDYASKTLMLNYGAGLTVVDGNLSVIGASSSTNLMAVPRTAELRVPTPNSAVETIHDKDGVTFIVNIQEEPIGGTVKKSLTLFCSTASPAIFLSSDNLSVSTAQFIQTHPNGQWLVSFPLAVAVVKAVNRTLRIEFSKAVPQVGSGQSICFT